MDVIEPSARDVTVVELPADLGDYDLVQKFMRFRRDVFVDRMGWGLHHAEGIEFEQYDTFDTVYVIAHRDREVIGGARLRRTNALNGRGTVVYSYMIRDACLGLLPGMPTNLCDNTPPVDPRIWELTRFAATREAGVAEAVLRAANDYLLTRGAVQCLFLGPPAFMRMARSLGWTPEPMGAVVGNRDGRFLAFCCTVIPSEDDEAGTAPENPTP